MKKREFFFLIILIVIGGILRFYNLNWDEGHFFHPDERNIANAVSRIHFFDRLNPEFFAYGGFSFYVLRAAGELLVGITNNPQWVFDWGHINIISRFFSAAYSTLTILALFFLARKMFSKEVAILASIFYTFVVGSIQIAHFGITENFLTLATLMICYLSIKMLEQPTMGNYIKAGVIVGIAAAAKTTALSMLIFPLVAQALILWKHRQQFLKKSAWVSLFFLSALLIFALFSPYTFLRWDTFMESMRYESGVALGSLPVPYTVQFTNTVPYLFQIKNLFWQIGPLFSFSLFGFLLLLLRLLQKKEAKLFIFLSFPVIYFAYVGFWHTKFIRFMLPLIPFFILFASYALFEMKTKMGLVGKLLLMILIAITALWGIAFFSIYTREQTRITASKWIYENIPSESKILTEHWDDGLPVPVSSVASKDYIVEQLTIYDNEQGVKAAYYSEKLADADYIIINSRRLYGTLLYLPDKYPVTSKYYQLLFDGELGYEKIAEFTSYPSLFGIEINDDNTEETFQVYEHPKVLVFKNILRLGERNLHEKLLE